MYHWWKLDEESRKRVWRLYGWFCGLMCSGSCCGVVASVFWMQYLVYFYQTTDELIAAQSISDLHKVDAVAYSNRFYHLASSPVAFSLEFSFLSVAKLLVLDRLLHVAMPRALATSQRWATAGRLVVGSIVVGNVVYVGSSIAAAAYFWRSFQLYKSLSEALLSNNSSYESFVMFREAGANTSNGARYYSYGEFCEVIVLILIVAVFSVLGALCARRMRSALRHIPENASEQLRGELVGVRRQIIATVYIVFLTFLLRSIAAGMFAVANSRQNNSCFSQNSSECNAFSFLQAWFFYTPEFQSSVEFIASPLTMMITLWGMTTDRTLQLMRRHTGDGKAIGLVAASAGTA